MSEITSDFSSQILAFQLEEMQLPALLSVLLSGACVRDNSESYEIKGIYQV